MAFLKSIALGVLIAFVVQFILSRTSAINTNDYYLGKRIILTGASKGIGRELAIQLVNLGARVVIAARTINKLEETVLLAKDNQEVTKGEIYPIAADVSKEEDCKKLVNIAIEKLGGIDILILNAAYSPQPLFFNETQNPGDAFLNVYRVNFLQSVYLVNFALSYLNKSNGSIVAVSSASSQIGMPKVLPYSSSKHALNGFFKGLHQEFLLTNTPISIIIMPLPYIHTEIAVLNWKPIGLTHGISPQVCAQKMIDLIPYRQLWSYIDWSTAIVGRLSSLIPGTIAFAIRQYLPYMSNLFN